MMDAVMQIQIAMQTVDRLATVGEERPDADSTTAQREVNSNETAKNRNAESGVEAETTTVIETNEQNRTNRTKMQVQHRG